MKIRYKGIEHERKGDAPFVGALISAISCSFNCKGCFNKKLKREITMFATAEDLIDTVLSNPFNEGIILAGLEWTLQPLELLELCKVANQKGLKIMIYTGCDLEEFYKRIGKAVIRVTGADIPDDDVSVQTMVGRVTLDYFVSNTYYIKTGTYDKNEKDDNYYSLGIKLSSKNQMVYEIKQSAPDLVEVVEHG